MYKNSFLTLTLPILMITLITNSMEITQKNKNITCALQFHPEFRATGYVGRSTIKIMQDLNIKIAPYAEHVMMIGHANVQASKEEIEYMYQEMIKTSPQFIELLREKGLDPYKFFMEQFSKDSTPIQLTVPVEKIINLQYGDSFYLEDVKISFHDTREKLDALRKTAKRTPEVFAMNNEDINELIHKEIITINPLNGVINHGKYGSGPKHKSIQLGSER